MGGGFVENSCFILIGKMFLCLNFSCLKVSDLILATLVTMPCCNSCQFGSLSLLLLLIQLFDGLDLLFEFHSTVLEPDLDLSFGET